MANMIPPAVAPPTISGKLSLGTKRKIETIKKRKWCFLRFMSQMTVNSISLRMICNKCKINNQLTHLNTLKILKVNLC